MKCMIFTGVVFASSLSWACSIKGSCEAHSLHLLVDGQIFDKVKPGPSGQCSRPDLNCNEEKEIICNGDSEFDETQYQPEPKGQVRFGSQYGAAKVMVKHAFLNRKESQEFVFTAPGTHDFQVDLNFLEYDPTRVGFYYRCTAEIKK